MSAPPVSICVPTWNGAAHLGETIRSALAQTHRDFELVVLDDASSDDSLRVAASFDDPRIRVHHNPQRLGLPANWNRCLDHARGEYVNLLFQDDLLEPCAIEKLLAALRAVPEASLAFGRRAIRHDDSDGGAPLLLGDAYPQMQQWFYSSFPSCRRGADVVRDSLGRGHDLTVNVLGEPSFVLLRKDVVRRAGGFDPTFRQLVDWELWLRLARDTPLVFVDETLGVFRVHRGGQSIRNSGSLRVPWEFVRLLSRIERYYGAGLRGPERRRLRSERWRCRRFLVGEMLRAMRRGVGRGPGANGA